MTAERCLVIVEDDASIRTSLQHALAEQGHAVATSPNGVGALDLVVRTEPDEERGLIVQLGAEFYPPALPERAPEPIPEEEEDEPQPIVEGQPTIFEPNPPPPKPKKAVPRKRAAAGGAGTRRPRKRKPE